MKIRMFVMDVDGTLTDGHIYISAMGEVMKAFDVKDGYGIIHLEENGIVPVIITGRTSEIVENRANELKIRELHQGIGDKLAKLKEIAERYQVVAEEIAYIGDDLNDVACMEYVGCSAAPNDAVDRVKAKVTYVCQSNGGRGAVREFISWILRNT